MVCPETGESVDSIEAASESKTTSHGIVVDGKYRITRRIGEGATGIVYEAQHVGKGWTYAVKLVDLDDDAAPTITARVREDTRALTEAAHPNISPVLDFGTLADGTMFVVSERLRGSSLKVEANGMPEDEIRAIMLQLLSALHAAHEAGVVHDNLKPSNIFLVRRALCPPLVKVLDFGGYGTPNLRYASPEALQRRTTDRRSDLWSVGVILYRMLTGRRPFAEVDTQKILAEIERELPTPPSVHVPKLAPAWDLIIRRTLDKDRRRRFADAMELADAMPRHFAPLSERDLLPNLASLPPSSGVDIDVIPSTLTPPHQPRLIVPAAPGMPTDPLGRVIANKYRLDTLIGTGSAGAVYQGVHVDLDRAVAVKILHPQNRTEPQFVARFRREARMASQLDHLNVTRVLDFGEDIGGLLYLVMEFVPGESLETTIQTHGPLPVVRVVNLGIQICNALTSAHALGIIHRDVKPENILLVTRDNDDSEPSDIVKVCDFGTAKLKVKSDGDLTGLHELFGSPAYMSPEQARCEEIDQRSDLYSLGVTLFEAVTGQLPLVGENLGEQLVKTQEAVPPRPSSIVTEIDPLLEDIILRLLAKTPAERHASAAEVRTELQEVVKQLAPPSTVQVYRSSGSRYPSE